MSVPNKILRRVVTMAAATSLVVGLVPAMATAAAPESRDISRFACPDGEVPDPGFSDDDDSVHRDAIACIVWYELASGVGNSRYGPEQDVRRDQMATFLANLLTAGKVALPQEPADAFDDDNDSVHELAINQLAELGVVKGTGQNRYSPARSVQRDQMASFLNNAYAEITGAALSSSEDYFTDDEESVHEDNINAVAGAGFAAGKTQTEYAPYEPVLRGQMASFLGRETDLLVEQGKIVRPSEALEVTMTPSSVRPGEAVSGTIIDHREPVVSATISGCGGPEGAGADDTDSTAEGIQYTRTIPKEQALGTCVLTFEVSYEIQDPKTVTHELEVFLPQQVTDGPELVSATTQTYANDTCTTAATSSTATHARVTVTFDEDVDPDAIFPSRFRLVSYDGSQDASFVTASGSKAVVTSDCRPLSDLRDFTSVTVDEAAVRDLEGFRAPIGRVALAEVTLAGAPGPDLLSATVAADGSAASFMFDEEVTPVTADFALHRLFSGRNEAAIEVTQVTSNGKTLTVSFTTAQTDVRGFWLAAGSVSDDGTSTTTNVDVSVLVGADRTTSPDLVAVAYEPDARNADGDAVDRVLYTFDAPVEGTVAPTITGPNTFAKDRFAIHRQDGTRVPADVVVRSSNDERMVIADYPDGCAAGEGCAELATHTFLDADAVQDADAPSDDRRPSPAQGRSRDLTFVAGTVAGPDLVSARLSTGTASGEVVLTFDEPLGSQPDVTESKFVLYRADGSKIELKSTNSTASIDGSTVVIRAANSVLEGAVLAAVSGAAVTDSNGLPNANDAVTIR